MEPKTMYRVEKFLPPECPNCRHTFDQEGRDWYRLLGDSVGRQKLIRKTEGYIIIGCTQCNNLSACIPLESYQLSDLEAARALLEKGFVNLQKVDAWGKMTKDTHVVVSEPPKVRILSVS